MYPIDVHRAMFAQPIHAQDGVVSAQTEDLEISSTELLALGDPLTVGDVIQTLKSDTICNSDTACELKRNGAVELVSQGVVDEGGGATRVYEEENLVALEPCLQLQTAWVRRTIDGLTRNCTVVFYVRSW